MEKFTTKNVNSSGTALEGYVTTTRAQIEEVLGTPQENHDSYEKVTTEWSIKFDDGLIATIYDWKRYGSGAPLDNERYEWHVGGTNENVLPRVSKILGVSVYGKNSW